MPNEPEVAAPTAEPDQKFLWLFAPVETIFCGSSFQGIVQILAFIAAVIGGVNALQFLSSTVSGDVNMSAGIIAAAEICQAVFLFKSTRSFKAEDVRIAMLLRVFTSTLWGLGILVAMVYLGLILGGSIDVAEEVKGEIQAMGPFTIGMLVLAEIILVVLTIFVLYLLYCYKALLMKGQILKAVLGNNTDIEERLLLENGGAAEA